MTEIPPPPTTNTESRWSYWSWVVKVPSVEFLDWGLNALGAEGWDLVASTTTVKTWINLTGNDLVFIFRKPGTGHKPSASILGHLEDARAKVVTYDGKKR